MSIYMSRAELEEISEGLITAYANKFSNRVIQSIDIEHFITEFLMLRIIDVNHTLVYYDHRTEGSKRGCYFNVNTTKTPAGMRQVPMLEFVKEA